MLGEDSFNRYDFNNSGIHSHHWHETKRKKLHPSAPFKHITSFLLSALLDSSSQTQPPGASKDTSASLSLYGINKTLYDINKEKRSVAMPSIVFLCTMVVLGLVGNVLVVYVFGFKMRSATTYRLLILSLAMYDLTACVVGMPGLVVEMQTTYTFYTGVACKSLRFGYHAIACGSSVTHVLVGIDRYRRVCRATGPQLSVMCAKVISAIMLAAVLLVSVPMFLMNDSVPVPTGVANVTGHSCSISRQYVHTPYPLMFNILLTLFIVVTVTVLIVLYALIGHKIWHRSEFIRSLSSERTRSFTTKSSRRTRLKRGIMFKNIVRPVDEEPGGSSKQTNISNRNDLELESVSVINTVFNRSSSSESQSSPPRQNQSKFPFSRKMTVTTFIMMVVYIISYFPIMVLVLLKFVKPHITDDMSFTQQAFYCLACHTYVISNVANPLVYIFMDVEFRRNCIKLAYGLRCK